MNSPDDSSGLLQPFVNVDVMLSGDDLPLAGDVALHEALGEAVGSRQDELGGDDRTTASVGPVLFEARNVRSEIAQL